MIKKILLQSDDDYIDLAKKELNRNNMNSSSEDIEEYFGIQFGTDEEAEDGLVNEDNIVIKCRDLFPTEYPCVMLYCDDSGFDRCGSFRVRFSKYIYLGDFE